MTICNVVCGNYVSGAPIPALRSGWAVPASRPRGVRAHYYQRIESSAKRKRIDHPYQSACGLSEGPLYPRIPLVMPGNFPRCVRCEVALARGWMP